jgi:hypothetical protein
MFTREPLFTYSALYIWCYNMMSTFYIEPMKDGWFEELLALSLGGGV